MTRVLARALALAVVLAAPMVAGCQDAGCDTAPDSNPPSDFKAGTTHTTPDGKVFESSAPNGQHIHFTAGTQVRVYHGLGGRPVSVGLWVSFSETGTASGNEAVPAGNMAEVLCVNAEYVLVRNNSCGDYWLRVVARDPVADATATCK